MIRQKGSKRFEVVVYVGLSPITGKERRVSRVVHGSRRDAERVERTLHSEVEQARHASSAPLTVGELLERWYEHTKPTWGEKHIETTRIRIDVELKALHRLRADKVRAIEIADLYRQLADNGTGWAAIRQAHSALRAAYRFGEHFELVPRNTAALVDPPKAQPRSQGPPVPATAIKLFEAAPEPFRTYLILALVTGARRGEMCAFRWSDLDGNVIVISRALWQVTGRVGEKRPKNDRERRVRIGPKTVELLSTHRERMIARAARFRAELRDDAFVFSDEPDSTIPWKPNATSARLRKVRDQLGLDGVRLHDARHAMVTWLLEEGYALADVAARAGHLDQQTTLGYSHVVTEVDGRAAETLEQLLGL